MKNCTLPARFDDHAAMLRCLPFSEPNISSQVRFWREERVKDCSTLARIEIPSKEER